MLEVYTFLMYWSGIVFALTITAAVRALPTNSGNAF